jgi:hypothetical protein
MSDEDEVDGCDVDMTAEPTPDEELDLLVLFADALDPNTPGDVESRKQEWEVLWDSA